MMTAKKVVKGIGKGVKRALKTKQLFLGIHKSEFNNPEIRPEYIVTVKVAEKLAGPDLEVELEASMQKLKHLAEAMVRLRAGGKNACREHGRELLARLDRYEFGQKRLDILVHSDKDFAPPVLVAEAKLSVANRKGILRDLERVFSLLRMFKEVEALEKHPMYGAVVFHLMLDRAGSSDLTKRPKDLLGQVEERLKGLKCKHPWLKCQAGLLSSFVHSEPDKCDQEFYEDGSREEAIAKHQFAFAPGLVLLGNKQDVVDVSF